MVPGETPFESAARILKRELDLVVEPKRVSEGGRFDGVGAYSYAWQFRQQEPQQHGLADVSLVLTIALSPAERAAIRLDYANDPEYSAHAWKLPEHVRDDETKHPALRRAAADHISNVAWRRLLADAPALDDAALGRRLRESKLLEELPKQLRG